MNLGKTHCDQHRLRPHQCQKPKLIQNQELSKPISRKQNHPEMPQEGAGRANLEPAAKVSTCGNGLAAMTAPPEGGWGWMVLLGTMTVNIVLIGHGKSFGVYFRPLMEEFDASPSRVAWLQALQISIFSFMSPISSVLSQVVGPRKVALVGGLMAFFGLAVSASTTSLEFLYMSFGVVQGIALTLTFPPGITMIARYFHRRRGLANGLTMAGNALGGILMPLVAHQLMAEYGLRGCFLIMGGILLHACVGAMLWQPVEWHQRKVAPPCYGEVPQILIQKSDDSLGVDTDCPQDELQDSKLEGEDTFPDDKQTRLNGSCRFESGLDLSMHSSTTTIEIGPPEFFDPSKGLSMYASGPDLHSNNSLAAVIVMNGVVQKGSSSPQLSELGKAGSNDKTYGSSVVSTESLPVMFKLSPNSVGTYPMKRGSRASSFMYLSSCSFGPTAGAVLAMEHLEKPRHSETAKTGNECLRFFAKFAIDRSIFQHSRFYVMTVSLFFHVLGYPGTQLFLPYRATTLGLSQAHAASLLSVMALTDLMGRIGCAWISDFHFCPRKYWFIGGMFASGIFALSLPFYRTYTTLLLGAAGFGFSCGAYIGLVVVLFADAYSPDKVALAYSIATVSGGFMALGGPPLMGYVLERTGSYLMCQSILGSAQLAGAAVWIAEPWAVRWERRRQPRAPEEEKLV